LADERNRHGVTSMFTYKHRYNDTTFYTQLQKRCSIHLYTEIYKYLMRQNVKHAKIQLFKHKIVLNMFVLSLLDAILI